MESCLLQLISEAFPDWEIENPNQKCHQEGYARWKEITGNGMDYFIKQVLPSCRGGIFLPFRDGALGAGTYKEAKFYANQGCPVWVIVPDGAIISLDLSVIQPLTVEETRSRIKTSSGETAPY
ncbi:MAG: hypothetical protein M1334_03715 [Patescibacteria group bacterium]|nr:hypothetical protein [Patescibacteria group bacterium]